MALGQSAWIILAITIGMAAGVGGFTFVYANGASYLTDRPEACANCYIMGDMNAAASDPSQGRPSRTYLLLGVALLAALLTILAVALLINILEHKQEARNPFYRVVELNDETEDPVMLSASFPTLTFGRDVESVEKLRFAQTAMLPVHLCRVANRFSM